MEKILDTVKSSFIKVSSKKINTNIQKKYVIALFLFLISLNLYLLCSNNTFNYYNNYSYLANSLVHARSNRCS